MIQLAETKPCPFCGADAKLKWVMTEHGKAARVACSREGECPSPAWQENSDEHEDDATCVQSVVGFWNTRADEWASEELPKLRMRVVILERENRILRAERDRAQKACEQIAARLDEGSTEPDAGGEIRRKA